MSDKEVDPNKTKKNKSKKGILLTVIITIAVISASFMVWFLPQGSFVENERGSMTIVFSDPTETLSYVNSQFSVLREEFETNLDKSKIQPLNETYMNSVVRVSVNQLDELMLVLLNQDPPESLLPEYINLMNDLKNYSSYISTLNN